MSYSGRALIRAVRWETDWTKHVAYRPVRSLGSTESIDQLLETPSWSVRSLLPTETNKRSSETHANPTPSNEDHIASKPTINAESKTVDDEITPSKLHHLLRLSALPLPKGAAEEARLLQDLRSQVHFVRHLQSLDTSDVTPLVAIRDESNAAREENEITLADVQPWLDLEEHVGRNGTVRRRKTHIAALVQQKGGADKDNKGLQKKEHTAVEDRRIFKWDTLPPSGNEEGRRWGRYYVVKRGTKTTTSTPATDAPSSQTTATTNMPTQHGSPGAVQAAARSPSTVQDIDRPMPEDESSAAPPSKVSSPSGPQPPEPPQQLTRQQQRRAARAASYEAILRRAKEEDTYYLRTLSRLVPGSTKSRQQEATRGENLAKKP